MHVTGRTGEGETPNTSLPATPPATELSNKGTETEKGATTILGKVDTLNVSRQNILGTLEQFRVRPTIDESDSRIPLIHKIVERTKTIQKEHKMILENILLTDMEAFAKPGEKLKQTTIAQHHLPLRSERVPVNVKSRPMSATEVKIALEVINGLVQV
jgi:hypothetical protein